MFNKHLWLKEWRGVRWIVVVLMLLFLYAQTGGLYSDTESWQSQYDYFQSDGFQKEQEQSPSDAKMTPEQVKSSLTLNYFTTGFPGDKFSTQYTMSQSYFALSILVVILGLAMVGWERYTRKDHFSLAAPFKRGSMIGTKLLLGGLAITVGYGISLWLGLWHMFQVIPTEYIDLDMQKVYLGLIGNLGTFLLLFVVAVFVGTVMGELLATVIAMLVITMMPRYLYVVWSVLMQLLYPDVDAEKLTNWTSYANVFLVFGNSEFEYGPFILQLILLVLFVVGSVFFYKRYSIENNGKVLAFSYLRIPSAILISFGGAILVTNFWMGGGSADGPSLTGFLIICIGSFIGCLVICYMVLYRNTWMRR
ncbi:hypothetical protein BMT55_04260 [Listeria newyorkensis]|uniref:ABC-2 family transporter protein n=1 Tax=Listeria newyorkensis TaxID=1497681 RepID=A0ABX4XS72_9LIST|nr:MULTISPECIES: ABC transporter permease subunit [Listeria]KGL41180.1 hypothetical protein EP56_11285 [Listeriaceae bacterium FSL A5-0209]KGL41896.1 hypothetical protein EP58_10140 [Listeria newyorkensis]PNP93985.1 hypothetical protein BMT55_04260 [Listeria newyorkensis]RQW67473.1 hypothetical protein DUK53_06900 [Listeria sp. SHR_NRA_18]WAO22610.1 hypothetical protein OTR81_04890 [Listeria newyorkensis]